MKNLAINEISRVLGREVIIEKPKDKTLAHYASPVAFSLAKELRKAPKIIAQELAAKFSDNEILSASAINGYLNFHIKPSVLGNLAQNALNLGENFAKNSAEHKGEKILLEYISANPTGPLHIGHVRGAVYGDTFAKVGNYLGSEVCTEYYINDAGNQIELLGISMILRAKEIFGQSVEYPEKYYRGEYIDELVNLSVEKFGKEIFYDDGRILELAEFAKDEVLKIIKKDLADCGITIQNWASEKSLYGELDATIAKLEKSGEMYKEGGKVWIKSSAVGDEKDRVVIREDGRPTYLAGDIVYHNNKFERGFERYVNVWGADHHGYIARLKAAIHFLGYDENALEIVLMQMVNLLKNGEAFKMSKRSGTSVLMSDVLSAIGKDNLRFMFISKKGETPLEFDIDELGKEDSSNPIFYINYAHARIYQIFGKAGKNMSDSEVLGADFSTLDEAGLNLAFEAMTLNEVLNEAFASRGLQKIPDFLKILAADFHKYYNENRVVGSENENAKLKLFALVALSIRTAFGLMGLSAKERM
ncbi:arginine--tRNA ligase [Campylobacter sp. JMF_01 NE2]|uniref:arginine--tRNA ligase n=1 Tax=unclassified Campylobacter TaxID=2593542 RepID=UPI0022E9ED75|nr:MULTISPECIES: arginine--tRNA ligase [unclassified Campylobacter]MDA3052834.1 arginine--tRNA ligase [Campylobacter sp. JMF_03 NE3]MDA3067165.1 arginine--tRNA ligase [Campylobacter sp. JMF_01 NE2]